MGALPAPFRGVLRVAGVGCVCFGCVGFGRRAAVIVFANARARAFRRSGMLKPLEMFL